MQIPSTVQSLIDEGHQLLNSNPATTLDWTFRARVYEEIERSEPAYARTARARLALSAVRKVFPLLQEYSNAGYWDELLPQAMTALVALVEHKADPAEARRVEDDMYHATGNWAMMYEDDESYPLVPGKYSLGADFAAVALYKALGEANGQRVSPFANLGSFKQVGIATFPPKGQNTQGVQFEENRLSGQQFSEHVIAGLAGTGDTAGAAASAYAMDDSQLGVSQARLKEFWQWWLSEALPGTYQI